VVDPTSPAVRGIRAKLRRAVDHLEALYTGISAFTDANPASLTSQPRKLQPEVWAFDVVLSKPIPIEWSVAFGEFVHNLRSALDNTVSLLAVINGGDDRRSAFPIYDVPDLYAARAPRKLAGLPQEAQAFIERLQPFPGQTAVIPHYLHSLEEMWNADKHRVLQPWGIQLSEPAVDFRPYPESVVLVNQVWQSGVVHHGAEAVRLTFSGPTDYVEMEGSVTFNVAIETPDDPTGEYGGTFMSLYDGVASVIHALLAMTDGYPTHPPY
jgi:hypothetical protein